jgi:hypothetical protein
MSKNHFYAQEFCKKVNPLIYAVKRIFGRIKLAAYFFGKKEGAWTFFKTAKNGHKTAKNGHFWPKMDINRPKMDTFVLKRF